MKRRSCFSGIGGQAVLEGIMMKNGDAWAVAVRKSDGKIAVSKNEIKQGKTAIWKKIPLVRGVFQFAESLSLGIKSLNVSAEYFAEEEDEPTAADKAAEKIFGEGAENLLSVVTVIISLIFAVGLFMLLPYFLASFLAKVVANEALLAVFEGLIRLAIFLIYIVAITAMKDIRRVYQYHGAEHKCINCIEHGRILDVKNVKKSSRFHKRCGTSFLLFVMIISIILFFFIRVDQPVMRVLLRLLLIPVIAGISYEFIRLAGKGDNLITDILSAPGLWLQRLTTKEPDDYMIEVAIAAVESVFDWKSYLKKNFEFDVDAYLGLKDYDDDILFPETASDEEEISEEEIEDETEDENAEETENGQYEGEMTEGSEDSQYEEEMTEETGNGQYEDEMTEITEITEITDIENDSSGGLLEDTAN